MMRYATTMLAIASMLAIGAQGAKPPAAAPASCSPSAPFAAWGKRHRVAAAKETAETAVPTLTPGEAVDLQLVPIGSLIPDVPFGKPPAAGDHGGIVAFHAAKAGIYRVALGSRAWIDVTGAISSSKSFPSVAHAMGAPCSGIRKTVDFQLAPGPYEIQLSAAADPVVPIAVAQVP